MFSTTAKATDLRRGRFGKKSGRGKPDECRGCPLWDAPGPVWGDGDEDADLVFLGEAPGPDEVAHRPKPKAFVGPAGKVHGFTLKAAGIDRKKVWTTNVVKCLPQVGGRVRKPTAKEIRCCTERWLWEELNGVGANAIVALGDTAFSALMGDEEKRSITEWRGAVVEKTLPGEVTDGTEVQSRGG